VASPGKEGRRNKVGGKKAWGREDGETIYLGVRKLSWQTSNKYIIADGNMIKSLEKGESRT